MAQAMTEETASDPPGDGPGAGGPSVLEVLDRARTALSGDDVSVRDVMRALGDVSFSPLLLIPALVVVTPASGIPLLSSICGMAIALISLQMLLGRDHAWLPRWIMRRAAPKSRLAKAFDWIEPGARLLDRVTRVRLGIMVERPFVVVPQTLAFLSGVIMPALELLPFTSSMLGAFVTLLAVGMMTRDGLLVVLSMTMIAAAGFTGHFLLTAGAGAATLG